VIAIELAVVTIDGLGCLFWWHLWSMTSSELMVDRGLSMTTTKRLLSSHNRSSSSSWSPHHRLSLHTASLSVSPSTVHTAFSFGSISLSAAPLCLPLALALVVSISSPSCWLLQVRSYNSLSRFYYAFHMLVWSL